ncbi:S-DNA-T family DNA segregation ATPase FtsK/SpoIIIE [Okibacterium sp. HSC-33S16]|uniref:FtsK/SpoIIIE domain-containing protein n=1 Tax=Okibacterium sp. HSC-33S16 TaxID=2910965 RepID=UPI00209F0EC4|nr:FtsK/SpoIIIE domain-containing protein [Okibacterium sp. HSC-33S16]MCP2031825.1 S-DNA-T family DNA segregation ATPase FtsK/SpoIIIE [Okibacterium sp. HSC-33S16]
MSVPAPNDDAITVPSRPVRSAPSPFPMMAALAPVVGSGLIWLVTHSPFALIFAALGPLIAIASVVDSRWSSGRKLTKDLASYERELDRLCGVIDERLEEERVLRRDSHPGARGFLNPTDTGTSILFGRWRSSDAGSRQVVLGTGTLRSTLRLDGAVGSEETRALRARARHVSGVPIVVDATRGIGIVGTPVLTRSCARAIALQLCQAIPPDTASIRIEGAGWEWASALPHTAPGSQPTTIRIRDRAATTPSGMRADGYTVSGGQPTTGFDVLLVLADSLEQIPTACRAVLEVSTPGKGTLHRVAPDSVAGVKAGAAESHVVAVEHVTAVEAAAFAAGLAEAAERLGVARPLTKLPTSVGFGELRSHDVGQRGSSAHAGSTLAAALGIGPDGPVLVDIVEQGPHAIVGGTTGSGKSELLTTWVASMAQSHTPGDVTFLLVDFKGGSAFAPLQCLPHVVGVLTDLDAVAAARALASLTAEVVYREKMLNNLGCRDISETGGAFPRLVIVVDEFAAMLDGFSELSALFIDIAARGRSLGMHLILCTQRPVGVMKDSLLANCGLRMSLRVHERGDSLAVVGTDAAAKLSPGQPGRLILAAGGSVGPIQVGTVTPQEIADIAALRPSSAAPRRPWLDPLPSWVPLLDLEPAGGIRFGRADLPDAQRQETAVWSPEQDGSVLVVGTTRSGKTTLLDTVTAEVLSAESASRSWNFLRVGSDDEETWDTVIGLAARLRSVAGIVPGTILLIDDLDSVLARLDDDYATRLRDAVVELLRDGPRRSLWLMITVQRLAGTLGVLSGFVGALLLLRVANRQEHLMSGGDGDTWVAGRAPGSGIWRGTTVQVAVAEPVSAGGSEDDARDRHPRSAPGRHGLHRTAPLYDFRAHPVTMVASALPQQRMESLLAENREHSEREPLRIASIGSGLRISVDDLALGDPGVVVLVGDADDWQSQWALFAALRQSADFVLENCTVSEFRTLTKRRELPPLVSAPGHGWHVPPGGQPARARLP